MSNSKEKSSLLTWITTHPKKMIISILLIFIPVFIIILALASFNKNANKFYFSNSEDNAQYLYNRDLSNDKQLNKYVNSLSIELKEVSGNKDNKGDTYKFIVKYEPLVSSSYTYTYSFQAIMKANWLNKQTNQQQLNASTTNPKSPNLTINFPYETPNRRLLVLKVGLPSLIIKMDLVIKSNIVGTETETVTIYYKYNLNNINYEYNRT